MGVRRRLNMANLLQRLWRLQVLAAVYSCGAEEVKAGVESKLSPLLPEGTSPQAWAAGLADKEHLKIGKPVAGLMQKQDAPAK